MSILVDWEISLAVETGRIKIDPYVDKKVCGRISYGLSETSYDFRLSNEFKVAKGPINPLSVTDDDYELIEVDEFYEMPPNSFVLARSLERISMPNDMIGFVYNKSTIVRCGTFQPVTPLQPGWSGYITLEFVNAQNVPVRLYANEGCGSIFFHKISLPRSTYEGGKYDNQVGVVVPK